MTRSCIVACWPTFRDYFLLDTATLPHGSSFLHNSLIMASIDHAMWFHRPLRVDEWLLYAVESPSASAHAASPARACSHSMVASWRAPRRRTRPYEESSLEEWSFLP